MKDLVTLWKRPSYDGKGFTYYLLYTDEQGRRRQKSLEHADSKKAERQRSQFERDLRMGAVAPDSMKLSEFMNDCLKRTGNQIRESTMIDYESAMKNFISVIGNIDFKTVQQKHGEKFMQACFDAQNSPATVAKKLRALKRMFQLAVDRGQLDTNSLVRIRQPKSSRKKVRTYTVAECERVLYIARQWQGENVLRWDLLIILAMATGMRKSELLNLVWSDIDFAAKTIDVSPKMETEKTWVWLIKDADARTLPLTDGLVQLLADFQTKAPEGYPYVFVPPSRYDHIQWLRKQGKWSFSSARIKVINNFTRQFKLILASAGVRKGQFHDLRRTALSNLFANGMSEHDVMNLAGHANFVTTHKFYLAVADDLVDRARIATAQTVSQSLLQICCSSDSEASNEKGRQA